MKTSIPTKFPNWQASPKDPYTADIVRSRNIRLSEISVTGEVDTQNVLSLTSSQSELVSSIFKDPKHLISFAVKNKSYYLDSFDSPTPVQYSPDLASSFPLNPQSTGIISFPRGISNYDAEAYSGSVVMGPTTGLTYFRDVTGFSRAYTYTEGQTVIGVRMKFAYTQSSGQNSVNITVSDSTGNHIITTGTTESAQGQTWDYWFLDGAGGCNLNDPVGFTVKVRVATDNGGNISVTTLNNGGSGYAINDIFNIQYGGNVSATGKVLTVNGSGVVLTYQITNAGAGYYHGTGLTTNETSGVGTGLKINITGVSNDVTFSGSSSFDFMYEVGTSSLISTGISGLYTVSEIAGTGSAVAWYPGAASYTNGYAIGYPSTSSIFKQYYPTILKMFNDRILLIGNGSEIHWVDTNGNGNLITPGAYYYLQTLNVTMGAFSVNQFSLPAGYVIEWMDITSDTVYIGATKYSSENYFEETGDTLVWIWQPQAGSSMAYRVTDGRCRGKVLNNFLYILTCKGNIKLLYSGEFQQLTQIYNIPDNYTIQLPHTNGVDVYEDKIAWLVPGNKYSPAGIYVFDPTNNNVYHKHSAFYTTSTEYDIGGNQPQAQTGALMFYDRNSADMFFAGIDGLINQTGSYVGGLFDTLNIQNNNISNNGYLELKRIKSTEVDEIPDSYSIKYRGVGTIMLAQKKSETSAPCTDGVLNGDWGTTVTNPSSFTMASIPSFMKKGDRITVLDGVFEGYSTVIKSISGLTVNINPINKYHGFNNLVGNGGFTFLWERLGYNGVFTNASTLTVDIHTSELINIGDELEFTAGLNAGHINYVTAISGTTVTLLNAMDYVGSNYTLFNIDKYSYLYSYLSTAWDTPGLTWDSGLQWDSASADTNNNIVDERNNEPESADFVQYKLMITGDIKIREFQVNTKPNFSITNNTTGIYNPKKKK
jgi:hypothetical protein